jgi:hypothetical protein
LNFSHIISFVVCAMSDKVIAVAGAVTIGGYVVEHGSKLGELATDKFGRNRPKWMRGTGFYTGTQAVGRAAAEIGTAVLAVCLGKKK